MVGLSWQDFTPAVTASKLRCPSSRYNHYLSFLMLLNIFQFSSLPPVRVVFEVTMEGSARKVITVRSALIVKNKLETPMELRLDSPSAPDSKCCIFLPYYGESLSSSPRRFTTASNG